MRQQTIDFNEQQQAHADRLVQFLLIAYFFFGLAIAPYFDTWAIATGVGALNVIVYYTARHFFAKGSINQYVLGGILGIFTCQFIYQMHGMSEMRCTAFISSVALIVFRNWRIQIPLAIVVLSCQLLFGYLQFIGVHNIFFATANLKLDVFLIHLLLSVVIFFLSGLWAFNFRRAGETYAEQSYRIGELDEANRQHANLVALNETLQQSNESLKQAHDELKRIFNNIEEVLFSVDVLQQQTIHISAACEKVYGYSVASFMANNQLWSQRMHPDDAWLAKGMHNDLSIGKTLLSQYRIIHKDGTVRWLEVKMIPTMNEGGMLCRIDGISNDISLRKLAETKLSEEKKKIQQQVTRSVITAQENEKWMIGEELRNNINPILATAKLYLGCLLHAPVNDALLLKQSHDFIGLAMNEIRALSGTLLGPALSEKGLLTCIADLLQEVTKQTELRFVTQWGSIQEAHINEALKSTVYRILQEQLNNIALHAKANLVFITISQTGATLVLDIHDNGRGFDTSINRKGVGLQNISSRAELYDGRMHIVSAPGQGCRLNVTFKLQCEAQQVRTTLQH